MGEVQIGKITKRRRNKMQEIFRSIRMRTKAAPGSLFIVPVALMMMLILAASVSPVNAIEKPFTAVLTGGQEVPQNDSEAFGVVFVTFDTITKTLCYSITFNNLGSDETAAHFHGPAAPGQDAGVVFSITPVPGKSKNGCVGPLSTRQIRELDKGQWYINVHSVGFPEGEIRGQVLPIPANVKY
jgi:hypothetical protein